MEESARLTQGAGLSAALAAVLPGAAERGRKTGSRATTWVVGGQGADGLDRATAVAERDLPKRLRAGPIPAVLVLAKLSPTIVRALRAHPPDLLVLTGPATVERWAELQEIEGLHVLGPNAVLRQGDGDVVACGPTPGELEGLLRALGPGRWGLALCPTPAWLHAWLGDPRLAARPVAGYVEAGALSVAWARAATARTAPTVLVPLGVPTPSLTEPDDPAAAIAVGAHALERLTGPVFPSPRVVARVLEGLARGPVDPPEHDPLASPLHMALWQQARRALPSTGAVVGMERPRGGEIPEVPTAAFLAQRALLRAEQAIALSAGAATTLPRAGDDDGLARAREVLAGAGPILTDHESKVVLRGFGIEVTRQAVASSASGAVGFADRIGYPVVLKALSPDLRRRADIGAIALELGSAAVVRRAYGTIVDAVEHNAPTARLDGVLVAEMVEPGLDVRAGAIRLPGGDLALWGQVGEATTPIEPVLAMSPLSTADARLLAHAVLSRAPVPGLRRGSDPEIEDFSDLLLRLDALVRAFAERLAIVRVDPVRLCGAPRGAVVLDARIVQRPHVHGR